MPRMKKTRGRLVYQVSQKRPIDKNIITIRVDEDAAQQELVLYTATFPATMTGLRWDGALMMTNAGSGSQNEVAWAIVLNQEGLNPDVLSFPSIPGGATLYQPEQNVLAFGREAITFETGSYKIQGSTKTMRKLQGGDQLLFIYRWGTAGVTALLTMDIQFFMKS